MTTTIKPVRGEIWTVRFDPSEGDEIQKIRPAVVINVGAVGRMKLHIVVPVTGWQPPFSGYSWMVHISPTVQNGLLKESAADAFQVRSLSAGRFQQKMGKLPSHEIDQIAAAIALCVGYQTN